MTVTESETAREKHKKITNSHLNVLFIIMENSYYYDLFIKAGADLYIKCLRNNNKCRKYF